MAIQGCDYKEAVIGLLALISLLLAGAGGSVTSEGIEITMTQTSVGFDNTFVSQSFTFKAKVSDPNEVDSYDWDFGDGSAGSGQIVTHVFMSTGTFEISVTVDRSGNQKTFSTTIIIKETLGSFDFSVDGTGSGTITGSPASINCIITNDVSSGTCTDKAAKDSVQTLTATAVPGFQFDSWLNCSNPSGITCNHLVTADTTITANFVALPAVTLTIEFQEVFQFFRIVSDTGGIDCSISNAGSTRITGNGTCSADFPTGTIVMLTTNGPGGSGALSRFIKGCVALTSSSTISVTMNSDETCIGTGIL